ncbi:pseudomurein-binding repeat-containing protein [Methanobacterium alcaliphilum]|uniref:pseudomurein-binding repeat-containing protein n=1 Tax=Methanobacterium alcaliphilum TaxID=392018 RepID=UPI00200AF48B|nr:pseudomurein-binding repeat-containing protein [Methanobacterium alcaliphilum]MCK9151573.1 hypothetical protein [Methanobacterium alcaliphilum]
MNDLRNHRKFLFPVMILLCCLLFVNAVSAVDVFITSDSISGDKQTDVDNLNSIKSNLENGTLKGNVNVTVDKNASKPGEGERALSKAKTNGVAVYLAASCPGAMKAVANKAKSSKKVVIFVNVGKLDLKKTGVLRRAWDDNFSDPSFAGIKSPYIFLTKSGIWVIQPNVDCAYGTRAQKNKFIADQISKILKSRSLVSLTSTSGRFTSPSNRYYDTKLILSHKVSPATLAKLSLAVYNTNKAKKTIKTKYYGYSTPKYLLMTTDYMNGAIKKPIYVRGPKSSRIKSTFSGSLTRAEIRDISTRVNRFMRKYKRAPSYVRYNGKLIGYKDLLLMYSTITKSHTSKSKMVLPKTYKFKKVYRY